MSTHDNSPIDKDLKSVAHLVDCAADGEVDTYAGKRHTARVSDAVQLEMTDDVNHKPVPVSMHNVSETGCAFWIRRALNIHSLLFLREFTQDNSAPWMPARVTHCTQGIRGFLVGVAFGEDEQ